MSTLEKELGYALFRHGVRQVQLTAAGRIILQYAEEMLQLAAKASSAGDLSLPDASGRLGIGSNTAAAAGPLPGWIRDFVAQSDAHALLSVDLNVARTPDLVPLLRIGGVEVAFVSPLMAPPASKTVLHFSCPLVLCAATTHPMSGARLGLQDLAGLDVTTFVTGPAALQMKRIQRALTAKMRVVSRSNSAFVVRQMAESGVGLAILPYWVAESSVRAGSLTMLEVTDYELGAWDVAVVRWRDRTISRHLSEFLDFLTTVDASVEVRETGRASRGQQKLSQIHSRAGPTKPSNTQAAATGPGHPR